MTTTFFFLQDVNGSLELGMRSYLARVGDNHTTFDFVFVNTTEQQTYVVTSLTFVKNLAEHFHTGNDGFLAFCAQTDDLNFFTRLDDTGFDTASSHGTTTSDGEDVFHRHEEGFVNVTGGQVNPRVYCVHEFHDFVFPLGNTVQTTKGRTADDRGIVTIKFIE